MFAGLRTFAPIARHVGPIMRKDVGLFAAETRGDTGDRDVLLGAADRFLALLDHPRPGGGAP